MKLFLFFVFIIACRVGASPTLISNSPFMPKQKVTQEHQISVEAPLFTKKENDRFVLKGVTKVNGVYIFSVYDQKTQKSEWIEPFQQLNGFQILRYIPEKLTIIYTWQGVENQLTLATADETNLNFSGTREDSSVTNNLASKHQDKPIIVELSKQSSHSSTNRERQQMENLKLSSNFIDFYVSQGSKLFANTQSNGISGKSGSNQNFAGTVQNTESPPPPVSSSSVNRVSNASGKLPTFL